MLGSILEIGVKPCIILVSQRFVRIVPQQVEKANLLVVAPTGSGKTTNTLRACWELVKSGRYRRIIVLAPTRSACEDIARTARAIAGASNVAVDTSDARLEPGWNPEIAWSKPIIVTTYERADSVVMSNPSILENSIVVIDEAHNMLFPERATAIIDLLSHIKMLQEQGKNVRVVLLSATMPMVEELREYLNADLISLGERPVKLEIKTVEVPPFLGRGALPYYRAKLPALIEVLKSLSSEHAPVLIYVPNKRMCEEIAREIKERAEKGELRWLKPEEVVYHHAGLPPQFRRTIEEELKKPNPRYKVVVATDTLSQSVNLSFRTVIVPGLSLFTPTGRVFVEPAILMQVLGRAGRPGYSNKAYGIIIHTPEEREIVEQALARSFGAVRTIGDYYALPIRLAYVGKNIELWARYAPPFIDKERLYEGLHMCYAYNLLTTEGLTPLGRALAKEYAPSTLFPLVDYYINLGGIRELESLNKDKETSALALTLAIAYLLHKLYTQEKYIDEKKLEAQSPPFSVFVPEAEHYELSGKVGMAREIALRHGATDWTVLVEPDVENVLYVLYNPDKYPADMLAEACRKASQIVTTLTQHGLLNRQYEKIGRVLMNLFKSYRRLLKQTQNPEVIRKYLRMMLRPENMRFLVSKRVEAPLDTLFIYAMSMNTENLEHAYAEYLRSLEKWREKRTDNYRVVNA